MPPPLLVHFTAGQSGSWQVTRHATVIGAPLPQAARLHVEVGTHPGAAGIWCLRGVASHARYATASEVGTLGARQPALGRADATCAALIPIQKSEQWWALAQDERRAIFEERSRHTARSLRHLPAVARRLHHCRDLGEAFDFLTWFEFAPAYGDAFEDLVGELRGTEEWRYVVRETDIRVTLA